MDMVYNDATDHSTSSNTSAHLDERVEKSYSEEQTMETGTESVSESAQPPQLANPEASNVAATPAPVLIPSMRGMMTYAGGSIVCKGKWAMSDDHHAIPGHTSDFEFKLVKKDEQCSAIFPVDGIYQGWFAVKQPLPLKGSFKVEDKEMELRFTSAEEGSHDFKITGHGSNKYGKFNLYGTLSEQGAIHIYREYYILNPVAVPSSSASTPKRPVGRPEGSVKRSTSTAAAPSLEVPDLHRESSGRIRKQSSLLKEYQDPSARATPRVASTPRAAEPQSIPLSVPSSSGAERSHRLAPAMRKCSDLLREMSKLPQARWFLEPVDPVKLQIPDYPKIIKTPMDFSTIRQNLESGVYETIDAFAEDVRLVFRNAITFNAAKDNIVHIHAREVSAKFEDRYRSVVAQLEFNPLYAGMPAEPKLARSASTSSFSSSRASNNKKRSSMSSTPRASLSGPRGAYPFVPPAAVDGNITKMMELQRQMEDMKAELDRLRSAVHEKEIVRTIRETTMESVSSAPLVPLTLEEKRLLVHNVGKLPPERMDDLIQIIRDGLPEDKKDDDITEVPLDILDTATLRRLQRFVKDNIAYAVKKRPSTSVPRAKSEPSFKKARRSEGPDGVYGSEEVTDDIGLFDHHELLTEKFDDHTAEDSVSAMQFEPEGLPHHLEGTAAHVSEEKLPESAVTESFSETVDTGMSIDRDDEHSDWATLAE